MKLSEFNLAEESHHPRTTAAFLRQANETQTPYPRDKTVARLFIERATERPDAVAIVSDGARLSYWELDDRSNRVALFLLDRNLQPENLVAVMLDSSPDVIAAMLGVLRAGGAYLAVSPDWPIERISHILHDSRAPVLIAGRDQRDKCRQLRAAYPPLKTILFFEGKGEDLTPTTLSESAAPWSTNQPNEFDAGQLMAYTGSTPLDRSRPGTLAYVIYTSGTTGEPKGVMVEHQSILRLVLNTNYIQLGASDRILQMGALSFDASTFEIWGALLNGGCLCLASREILLNPGELARLVKEHQITVMLLIAGLFNTLVSTGSEIFEGPKTILVGGERLSPHHINRVRREHQELRLMNVYGPTENTSLTTAFEIHEEFATDIPIGRPIANTTVHILNERLEAVPVGVQGELYCGGDGLARGYLNDPGLTAAKFIPHPFAPGKRLYKTGDLARWRNDGTIDYLGRVDQQVKIRGHRIEPGEIEACLLQHERVQDAVVLAKIDSLEECGLVAYFTARGRIAAEELRLHLRAKLPDYMIPRSFVSLEKLPLTGTGKVDRVALLNLDENRGTGKSGNDGLLSATENELIAIWQEVLGRSDFGVTDDFFDLGGHSLRAVKLMYLIQQRLGILLPFTAIFTAPSVSTLTAKLLDAVRFGHQSIDEPMVALQTGREKPNLFAFPPGTGDALGYGELAKRLDPLGFYAFNFIEADTRTCEYADLILKTDGIGPYVLFGYSGGGNLAFRTAKELERRGERVSYVVMLDSSYFLEEFRFPAEEARRLALEFVGNEEVQAYLVNPVLKDKVIRRIERYYESLTKEPDDEPIDANIHVIMCDNSQDEYRDDDGRLIASKSAWATMTRNEFRRYQGHGEHGRMLHSSHLEANALLLRRIFATVSAGERMAIGREV